MRSLLLFFIFFSLISCEKNTCDQAICTEEFRTVTIQIIDSLGNDVLLDSSVVIRQADQQLIQTNAQYALEGYYDVLTDNQKDKTTDNGETFIFKGFLDNVVVVNEPFVINKYCCHINYISGKTIVTL